MRDARLVVTCPTQGQVIRGFINRSPSEEVALNGLLQTLGGDVYAHICAIGWP